MPRSQCIAYELAYSEHSFGPIKVYRLESWQAQISHVVDTVRSLLDSSQARNNMISAHLEKRGITDKRILEAFRSVPREAFLPPKLTEFAYQDTPLPIGENQTISQPYIVAFTAQALVLQGSERVLEVGAGSGYAAAILSRLAKEVFTIERVPSLADSATERLQRLGFANVKVMCGDGSLGWPQYAPFDAIAVAAGGPKAPPALLSQLAIGGRLVIPIGPDEESQVLVRIERTSETSFDEQPLLDVRFVPLIGEQAWPTDVTTRARARKKNVVPVGQQESRSLPTLLRETAERIDDIETCSIDSLLERIGHARIVLLGEATHGTSEFYRMRARITRELIVRKGFDFVAVEADWPDAARVNEHVSGVRRSTHEFKPFARFPMWMWRNEDVATFVDWLRAYNQNRDTRRVGFYGLDLYSMFTSIAAVLSYLDGVDPSAARIARHRYGTLTPWQKDPAAYGEAVLAGRYESSETAVVAMLREMLSKRLEYAHNDGDRFFDAYENARLVADAERYYRSMYYGSVVSWNQRDAHMFDTLRSLLSYYGPEAKGIVWEHNSHVGDATATEMGIRGERNVGQLCRAYAGEDAYIVGFGTDHGTVAAASNWDEPMEQMRVIPARPGSYERLFHETRIPAFLLPLRHPKRPEVREGLSPVLLERAIGVVYRPRSELASHYFHASLPRQFDEYIWFDETSAVEPLPETSKSELDTVPDTYPFGL